MAGRTLLIKTYLVTENLDIKQSCKPDIFFSTGTGILKNIF